MNIENLEMNEVLQVESLIKSFANPQMKYEVYKMEKKDEPDLNDKIEKLNNKIDSLSEKIGLIFGKHVLINGRFIEIK